MKRQQGQTFGFYSSRVFLTAIGLGGLHFTLWNSCQVDIEVNGKWVSGRIGQRECAVIAILSTMSLGFALQTYTTQQVIAQATRAGMILNANNVDASNSQFNNVGRDQVNNYHSSKRGLDLDTPDFPTEFLHGYHERNLTYRELMSANFTHRTAIHGFKGPVEVWHQEHPDRPNELTTHVGIYPHLSAEGLKQAHEKRYICSFSDWGITLHSGWEAHWCKNGIGFEAPNTIYYGFETYNPSRLAAFQSDVGAANDAYSGFVDLVNDIEKHISARRLG